MLKRLRCAHGCKEEDAIESYRSHPPVPSQNNLARLNVHSDASDDWRFPIRHVENLRKLRKLLVRSTRVTSTRYAGSLQLVPSCTQASKHDSKIRNLTSRESHILIPAHFVPYDRQRALPTKGRRGERIEWKPDDSFNKLLSGHKKANSGRGIKTAVT